MTIAITHAKVSGKSDGADTTLIQPSDWNAGLSTSMATGKMVGRSTAGTGSFEEITPGSTLSLSGGNLQTAAMTGDVTTSANSFATTIANSVITFAKLATATVATAGEYLAGTASKVLSAAGVWSAAAEYDAGNTGATTVTLSMANGFNQKITATGNFTLAAFTNVQVGMSGTIRIIQDGTGSRTWTLNSVFKIAGGSAAALSTAASSNDCMDYKVETVSSGTATRVRYTLSKAVA